MEFPPIPSWEAAHPLLVHFPVALLLTVPLFAAAGFIPGDRGRAFRTSALILMLLGSVAAHVAVLSGEAAEIYARGSQGVDEVIHEHEEGAESVRTFFIALTLLYAVLYGIERRLKPGLRMGAYAAHLLLYLVACVALANAAHLGGRLVHEFGVRAVEAKELSRPQSAPPVGAGERR